MKKSSKFLLTLVFVFMVLLSGVYTSSGEQLYIYKDNTSIALNEEIPFEISCTLDNKKNIVTNFTWIKSFDSSLNIELIITEVGSKDIYKKEIKNKNTLLNFIEVDKLYSIDVKLYKKHIVSEVYTGQFILRAKSDEKDNTYNLTYVNLSKVFKDVVEKLIFY